MPKPNANDSNDGNNVTLPKHIPFPDISNNSEIAIELLIFLFAIFSGAMQFLHIYRTAWWLPDSHIHHVVNFHLIDPYLIIFIVVILSRRICYAIIVKLFISGISQANNLKIQKIIIKSATCVAFIALLGSCIVKICVKQNYLSLFLLLYPLIVYILIFGLQIEPFLRMIPEAEATYMNFIPMHCCSSNPATIRDEIELFKNDFNNRFKQVIFTSLCNAYYSGFVPCFFAQNFIFYDVLWATQHIFFVWFGGFMMCIVFCFPAKYCDILHRASLHLGRWNRFDSQVKQNSSQTSWSKNTLYSSGSIVKYSGEFFRSSGLITTAIPGNASHSRYQRLFQNPSTFYVLLTGLQVSLVISQILLLCFSTEWYYVLSLSFLTLTNHHTLFQIVRDYFITQKVYAAESSTH